MIMVVPWTFNILYIALTRLRSSPLSLTLNKGVFLKLSRIKIIIPLIMDRLIFRHTNPIADIQSISSLWANMGNVVLCYEGICRKSIPCRKRILRNIHGAWFQASNRCQLEMPFVHKQEWLSWRKPTSEKLPIHLFGQSLPIVTSKGREYIDQSLLPIILSFTRNKQLNNSNM